MIEPNNPISESVAADGYEMPRRPVKVQRISITRKKRKKHGNQVLARQTAANFQRRLRAKPPVLGGGHRLGAASTSMRDTMSDGSGSAQLLRRIALMLQWKKADKWHLGDD